MQDTSNEIRKKHFEIIFSKTQQERFSMGVQMMEDVRTITLNSIRSQNPGITDVELKIEFIKRYYKNDLSPQHLEDVVKWLKKQVHSN